MSTIHDVARQSGVSITTVSMVLNKGSRPVSAESRRRVLEAARALNYTPNANARALVSRRTQAIGVVFGTNLTGLTITNPYVSAVLQGVLDAATELEYVVSLYSTPWRDAERDAAAFRNGRVDGVLIFAPVLGSDLVPGLAGLGVPLVVVSAPSGEPGVPWVDIDNRRGVRLAVEHLLALGHTRIAHLMGNIDQANVIERDDAFRAALSGAGVALPAAYRVDGEYNHESGMKNAHCLLSLPEPPTAIFAGNDVLALAALDAARERGLRVPEDLSVVGFDDIPAATLVNPQLTTVRQPLTEIGARAMRRLVETIEGRAPEQMVYVLEPELVVRGTTAAPRPETPRTSPSDSRSDKRSQPS